MSTCNCDGTVSVSVEEYLFGDDVLKAAGITESQLNPLLGAADPRNAACDEAVGQLRATGQDPCNLDSPDDLQHLYEQFVPGAWAVIRSTPNTNALQRFFDVAAGTSSPNAPVVGANQPQSTNWTFIIGAVVLLAIGFVLVFK